MRSWTLRFGALLTVLLALFMAAPTRAQTEPTYYLPAGLACSDFDVALYAVGAPQVFKEFVDKNGNPVRALLAGKGSELTFVNVSSGASLTLHPNGSVQHTTFNPDGTRTVVSTGHNVIILFPGDTPSGPTTTLHVGRVVYTVAPGEVFTIKEVSGRTTDICAALGG